MKIFLQSALGLVAFYAVGISAKEATQAPVPAATSVVFHFPESVKTASLKIRFFIRGRFGPYRSSIQGEPNIHDYSLTMGGLDEPGSSVKGYVYGNGYGFATFTMDLPISRSPATITIEPKPLGDVRLSGHVRLPTRAPAELKLLVAYSETWACEFFGIADCLVDSDPIGSAPVAGDGAFGLDVPDFASDQALRQFTKKGHFSFRIVDVRMNTVFWVEPDVPVAASYPTDLQLNAVVP